MVEVLFIPTLILFIFFLLTIRELSYIQNIRGVSKKRYLIIRRTYRMLLVYIVYFFIYQIILEYVNRYNNDILVRMDPLLRIIVFFTISLLIFTLLYTLWTLSSIIFDPIIYEGVIFDPPVMGDIKTKEFLFSSIIPRIKRDKNTLLFMLNNLLINLKNKSKFQTFELKYCHAEVYEFK